MIYAHQVVVLFLVVVVAVVLFVAAPLLLFLLMLLLFLLLLLLHTLGDIFICLLVLENLRFFETVFFNLFYFFVGCSCKHSHIFMKNH
jgi:hypothetical protein